MLLYMDYVPDLHYHSKHIQVMLQIKISAHVKKLHEDLNHEDSFDNCLLCSHTIINLINNFNKCD